MWSSCPCVITNPLIFSLFLIKYVTSGITISIPSISSVGNSIPQSTTIISSPYSNTVIFFPISSIPPNGIIFKFGFLNLNSSLFTKLLLGIFVNLFSSFFTSIAVTLVSVSLTPFCGYDFLLLYPLLFF